MERMDQNVEPEAVPELGKRAVSGAGWIAAENAFVQGTSLIVFAIIAHFVSPADFGIISICFVVLQSLKILLVDNFAQAVTRKPAAFPIEFSTAFWLTVGFSCFCFAAIEAAAGLIAIICRVPELAYVIRQMGLIILFIGLSRTHECWMARHFQFRQLGSGRVAVRLQAALWGFF
jgi:O-antigen/teichoic acid export membrane protein